MSGAVILVSPAPVDGYPPVQYQARLLADAGHAVELLTQPLPGAQMVKFKHPGVRVTAVKPIPKGVPRPVHLFRILAQIVHFIAALTMIRARSRPVRAEIAFDPNGMMISDYAPLRPRRRVAHFHETVQRVGESHLETRLPKALRAYSRIVVADEGRAALLRDQMGLASRPTVTPNYPLRKDGDPAPVEPVEGFEVIYGGSISPNHMIDLVIRSVPLWPAKAHLTLLGDDTRPQALQMKALAQSLGVSDRVRFLGWVDLDHVIDRYRRAHLGIALLAPSHDQLVFSIGASNKRYQYMQAGLPQIGDLVPGVPEMLADGGIGRSIRDYSEQSIADLVDHYLRHAEERTLSGRRAEQLHLTRYNYQNAFAPTLRWIEEGTAG